MNKVDNWLSSFEDEGAVFLKSQDVSELSKGRTAKPLGSKETWGGKEYIKTATGWKGVGKKGGTAKTAHDFVHGEKKEQLKNSVGKTVSGKQIYHDYDDDSHGNFTKEDHIDAIKIWQNKRKEHHNKFFGSANQNQDYHHATTAVTRHEDAIKVIDKQGSTVEKSLSESINDFQKSKAARILSCYSNDIDIEKSGEGSKGGKVIGHTKSGKAIYADKHASKYEDFTKEDHEDAEKKHHNLALKYKNGDSKGIDKDKLMGGLHDRMAIGHAKHHDK